MRLILLLLLFVDMVFALDFKIGRGSYDVDFKVLDFCKHNSSYDITTFRVDQPRSDINDKIFYYFDLEFHTSSTKKESIEFANVMADHQFPIFGSANDGANRALEMIPMRGDFDTIGFDFNVGLGYDLIKKGSSYLAVAINSGATLPNISAKNLKEKVEFAYDMIKKWDLDVGTYKIGPSLRGKYHFDEKYSLFSSVGFGYQKAYVESDLFKSDVDSQGRYNSFELGGDMKIYDNFRLNLGYVYKSWSVDSVDVNLFNFFKRDVMRPFELDLKSRYTYIGIEYSF